MSSISIYTKKQEKANKLTHLMGIIFFIPAGFYLIWKGQVFIEQTQFKYPILLLSSLTLMSVFVLMIYVSSTLYHSANPFDRLHWRKFDHIAIFWGIAGTYLPFITVNYANTGKNLWLFFFMLFLAFIGTIFKLFFIHVNKVFYTLIYVLMGWSILFFGKAFFLAIPSKSIFFVVLGGMFYSIGVFFYLNKKNYYSHAIWHILVLLGSISHYFAVLELIKPQ